MFTVIRALVMQLIKGNNLLRIQVAKLQYSQSTYLCLPHCCRSRETAWGMRPVTYLSLVQPLIKW